MHLVDPRNGPSHDWPTTAHERTLVVASSPRTGSTLLCRALWDTGLIGCPKEYLNPMQLRDWAVRRGSRRHSLLRGPLVQLAGRRPWSDDQLRGHLHDVLARRTTPGGWAAFKVHHHHFQRFFVTPGRDPEAFLGPITWVRIRRDDAVAQAVSWVRARQSGAWVADQLSWRRPRYGRGAIDRALAAIDAQERGWSSLLADEAVLELSYEEVAADLLGAVNRCLTHAERPTVHTVTAALQRQASTESEAWCARYRSGR